MSTIGRRGRTLDASFRYNGQPRTARATLGGLLPLFLSHHSPATIIVPVCIARLCRIPASFTVTASLALSCVLSCAVVFPSTLRAQGGGGGGEGGVVGHEPESSPYTDVESGHELAIFGGYFVAAKDPAGVAPTSAPVVGLRESIHLGGPAVAVFRLSHVFSSRTVINPLEPQTTRVLGTERDGLTMFDLGLAINLTGDRAWHHLVPAINAGVGVASDLGAARDVGGYRFGTVLDVIYGGGVRWIPGGRLSLRANVDAYLYEHDYPKSYRTVTIDGSSVLPATHTLIAWRNNAMFTLGASYAILH